MIVVCLELFVLFCFFVVVFFETHRGRRRNIL